MIPEAAPVPGAEGGIGGERLLAGRVALEHAPNLAAAGDAEVEGAADPLGGEGEAMAGRVADEEAAVLHRRPEPVRDQVALVPDGLDAEPRRRGGRRLLDRDARIVGAGADARLAVGRHAPAVAAADQRAVDQHVECAVAAVVRMHLEPARERPALAVEGVGAEDAAPAERVDDERRNDVAAIGAHAAVDPPLHECTLEAGVALLPEQPAQLLVVERGPAPRQPHPHRAVRGGEGHVGQLLPNRGLEAQRLEPRERGRARRGGVGADLVAIEDEHVRAGPGELARDREPGKAGATDDHVGPLVGERPVGPPAQARTTTRARSRARGRVARPRTSKPFRSIRSRTAT